MVAGRLLVQNSSYLPRVKRRCCLIGHVIADLMATPFRLPILRAEASQMSGKEVGINWHRNFVRRHPELRIAKLQDLSPKKRRRTSTRVVQDEKELDQDQPQVRLNQERLPALSYAIWPRQTNRRLIPRNRCVTHMTVTNLLQVPSSLTHWLSFSTIKYVHQHDARKGAPVLSVVRWRLYLFRGWFCVA